MTETVLGLFRHGQTDWNIDLRLQGTADIPMNEFGIAQVTSAAKHVANQQWDLILSSPLGRARHSAEIIANRTGHGEIIETDHLLERAFGIGEGMLYSEWHEKFSHLDEIPGAESAAQITRRAEQLLNFIEREYPSQRILAVSHGALIRYVLDVVSGGTIPPAGERLQNASLHVLRHLDGWQLDGWAPQPLGS